MIFDNVVHSPMRSVTLVATYRLHCIPCCHCNCPCCMLVYFCMVLFLRVKLSDCVSGLNKACFDGKGESLSTSLCVTMLTDLYFLLKPSKMSIGMNDRSGLVNIIPSGLPVNKRYQRKYY